ncbi:Trehalase [Aphelenchoides besseyi]|nr:Trehalase [Aphelenchoides besseyi]
MLKGFHFCSQPVTLGSTNSNRMLGGIQIVFFLVPIVFGDQIPDHYKVHKFFPAGEQACDNSTAGPRHRVFCSGRLLEAVMAFNMYEDSKTFVDQALKFYADEVMANFSIAFPTDEDITQEKLRTFLEAHFLKAGTELAGHKPLDYVPEPRKLRLIRDPELRYYAYALNNLWPSLSKSINPRMINESEKHTLIYVPHPFIVPGGRFREYYYWDTYWVIKGLIASGMHTMIRSILSNFVYIIDTYGMIPNGGRIYYLARSQPPLLSGMFYEYYEATGDLKFVRKNIHELEFWDKHRSVNVTINGQNHVVFQFRAGSNVPRPESFREDVELVRNVESWKERSRVWRNLASAAESGLDFSSRWFKNQTELSTIDTTNVVPVELNAFICWNLNILSYFYGLIPGEGEKESYYRTRLFKFRSSFQKVFFVEKEDGWYDYNLRERNNFIEFYPSNAIPMFTQCYDSMDIRKVERAFDRLRRFGAFGFNNGVPSSLHNGTRQQWSVGRTTPNSWPPFQHMLIEGLRRSESPQLQEEGFDLAKQWVRVNYENFKKSGKMWEKYNVDGDLGIGGEYPVQAGFGWTNGVILDLLVAYADRFDLQSIMKTDRNLEIDFGVEEPRRVRPKKSVAVAQTVGHLTIVVFALFVVATHATDCTSWKDWFDLETSTCQSLCEEPPTEKTTNKAASTPPAGSTTLSGFTTVSAGYTPTAGECVCVPSTPSVPVESSSTPAASSILPLVSTTQFVAGSTAEEYHSHCILIEVFYNFTILFEGELQIIWLNFVEHCEKTIFAVEWYTAEVKFIKCVYALKALFVQYEEIKIALQYQWIAQWGYVIDLFTVVVNVQYEYIGVTIEIDSEGSCPLFDALLNYTSGNSQQHNAVITLIQELTVIIQSSYYSQFDKYYLINVKFSAFFAQYSSWQVEFYGIEIIGFGSLEQFISVTYVVSFCVRVALDRSFSSNKSRLSMWFIGGSVSNCVLLQVLLEASQNTSYSTSVRSSIKQFYQVCYEFFQVEVDVYVRLEFFINQTFQWYLLEEWFVEYVYGLELAEWGSFYQLIASGYFHCGWQTHITTSAASSTSALPESTTAQAECSSRDELIVVGACNNTVFTTYINKAYATWSASYQTQKRVESLIWSSISVSEKLTQISQVLGNYATDERQTTLEAVQIASWGTVGQFCGCSGY